MTTAVMQKPSLTLNRHIKAPPAKVFEAFMDPQRVAQWFGGGAPESKVIEIDPRVGGAYHFGFEGRSGVPGDRDDVMGVYQEISPPDRLVFSWHWKSTPERVSQVTIDLKPHQDGTLLTLLHEQFFDETARDNHAAGWGYGLDALVALLER